MEKIELNDKHIVGALFVLLLFVAMAAYATTEIMRLNRESNQYKNETYTCANDYIQLLNVSKELSAALSNQTYQCRDTSLDCDFNMSDPNCGFFIFGKNSNGCTIFSSDWNDTNLIFFQVNCSRTFYKGVGGGTNG